MKTPNNMKLLIPVLILFNLGLWAIFPPQNTLETNYTLQLMGETISSTAMITIAICLVLATRHKTLERAFGGLDKVYQTHKQVSILAFLLLILHFFIIPKTDTLINGKPLGMLSFLGITILILLSIAPRVPLISKILNLNYTVWRLLHKLMGVFFITGFAHYLLVNTISIRTIPGAYMLIWIIIGIAAFIYRQIISGFVEPKHKYIVQKVTQLNGTISEVILSPKDDEKLRFEAGQFVYVAFNAPHLREPHPFTVSSSPQEEKIRLAIKASGDWTNYLHKYLQPDTVATVSGAFGMLNYLNGTKEQIWISGGIGVTPFLSWIRSFTSEPTMSIEYYYCVHGEEDAVFLEELQVAAERYLNLKLHVWYSVREGHLSPEEILPQKDASNVEKSAFLCGPFGMMEGFAEHFNKMGILSRNIYYEEFNFR